MQRWLRAGCFELLVEDVRSLLREWGGGRKSQPTAVVLDSRTLQSTPESGARAGYDGARRRKGSKVHIAVDTLGHLLALTVTPADQGDREQVAALAEELAAGDRGHGRTGLCRPGLHWPQRCPSRPTTWPAARSGQAPHGKTRLRADATPLGRRAQLRLGGEVPPPCPRLRTARHHPQRSSSARLRHPHAP